MQIILLERVEKLGQLGDVVTVKPGYARNFLLPQVKPFVPTKPILKSSNRNVQILKSAMQMSVHHLKHLPRTWKI